MFTIFLLRIKDNLCPQKNSASSFHPYLPSSLNWNANDNEKQNIQNRLDAERTAENERLRLKREAEFEARKAQEAADRARKEFEKQAAYNAQTIHSENRHRDAARKQAEANQAAECLKKMLWNCDLQSNNQRFCIWFNFFASTILSAL